MYRIKSLNPIMLLTFLLCVSGFLPQNRAMAATPGVAPPIPVMDVNGVLMHPLDNPGRAAAVFFFIAHDCPMCNEYAPEIDRVCHDYATRNVAFYIVYTESDMTRQAAKKYAALHKYTCPVLLDTAHKLVKQIGATVTPETAVVDARGALLYRGRIDDRFTDYGVMRHNPSARDLRTTLDNVLNNRPVAQARTKAIGCFITGA